jgi:hypothetical protein
MYAGGCRVCELAKQKRSELERREWASGAEREIEQNSRQELGNNQQHSRL